MIKRILFSMSSLFISMAFLFVGNSLIISSVGVILKESGMSSFGIGLVNSCFYFGALLGTISAHKIISKIGHIRAFGVFTSLFSICIILHSLSYNVIFWSVLRFILGFCYCALLMLIESWLNEKAKNTVRSTVLGFYETVFYFSFGIGVLLIGVNFDNATIFAISACLIMFSSLPLNLIRIKQPQQPKASKISLPKIYTLVPLALVTSIIAGMLLNGFFSMSSLFILLQGYGAKEVSYFMFSVVLGGFLSQFLIGTISDKMGRKFTIILCASISLAVMLLFLFFDMNIYLQCVFAFLLGTLTCLYALALARANDMLEDKSLTVEVGRAVLFCYYLSSLFSPLILGFLMQKFGHMGFVWFYTACLVFLILFAIGKPNIQRGRYKRNPGNMVIYDD
ncbi:MFS transporter [Campylobacter avium]|nr:MFS transporter [Campylobacter avium]HJE65525.1 MFS transporter [Campylobacter avium]